MDISYVLVKQEENMDKITTITVKRNITSEHEMRSVEKFLKTRGYSKTADCMWCKIYSKDDTDYVLNREY